MQTGILCSLRGHDGVELSRKVGIVRENVTISYRGASYEIGRGRHFYGIWAAGGQQSPPLEWWPETPEGWSGAWSRFTGIEAPGTIVPVTQRATPVRQRPAPAGRSRRSAVIAAALLAVGVACGIAGLFPSYVAGASLVQEPSVIVPHAIYLAVWTASAALILLGGARLRVGALLALGTSIVTFGLFFADAGTVIAAGTHVMGAGLVLGLVGWLACAAGSGLAFRLRSAGAPGRPRGSELGPAVALLLAGLGAAAAFAPSWDSYTLQTALGATQTTAGNAFANPAPVIAGDVAVMVALVAVVIAAALWRPVREGAALLAGAIIPMLAQAISALVQLGEPTSPQLFGISPAQASQAGLTISNGVTPAFWIYCAFAGALVLSCAWMLIPAYSPREPQASSPPAPAGGELGDGVTSGPGTQQAHASFGSRENDEAHA